MDDKSGADLEQKVLPTRMGGPGTAQEQEGMPTKMRNQEQP